MTQGFYTLDEAANKLGVAPDELNRMAQRREIRAFSERGTWKFRTQDVEDLAQQRGGGAPADSPSTADTVGMSPSFGDDIPLSGGDDPLFLEDAPLMPATGVKKPTSGVKKPTSGLKSGGSGLDDDLIPVDDDIFSANLDSLGHSSGLGKADPLFGGDDDDDSVSLGGDAGQSSSGSKPPSSKTGSGSRMVMEQGSFEFELSGDSGIRLDAEPSRKSSGKLKPAGDSDVRLDFEGGTLDDSLVPAMKGDSDVRLTPSDAPLNLADEPSFSQTEEIDLDRELEQADEASMRRRGNTTKAFPPRGATPGPGKTQAPPQAKGTMLPESSPFELSEEDLGLPESSESSVNQPMGSEFELTLAPEEEGAPSPLSLGDDEDVDLGDLPASPGTGSGVRAELSGVNLHDPADSGISLEEDEDADDSVSFDLTLDDGDTGPKTIKGKLPPAEDSDSEFELTLDDTPGASAPSLTAGSASASLEEKDIFETDFDLPALDDESASQAVALDEADTDLESSDFDLAVESSPKLGSASTSGAMALDEAPGGSMESVDEMLLDEEETQSQADYDEDEDEEEVATIPAAEAEWGMAPVIVMACSIVVMFVGAIMAFELLHGMWGYHTASKPAGVVVRSIASAFTDDLPKE